MALEVGAGVSRGSRGSTGVRGVPKAAAAAFRQGLTLVHNPYSTRAVFVTETSKTPYHMGPTVLTLS